MGGQLAEVHRLRIAWPEAVRLVPRLPPARLVTHRLPAARYAEGMALVKARDPSVIKILLAW